MKKILLPTVSAITHDARPPGGIQRSPAAMKGSIGGAWDTRGAVAFGKIEGIYVATAAGNRLQATFAMN